MDAQAQKLQNSETHEALTYQFIITELELASTFCELATSTGNLETAARNILNARRAYAAASKTSQGHEFCADRAKEIERFRGEVRSRIDNVEFSRRERRSAGKRRK